MVFLARGTFNRCNRSQESMSGRWLLKLWNSSSPRASPRARLSVCWLLETSVLKKQLESELLVPFCLRERSSTVRMREYACIPYVDTFLCAKENYVFPVPIPLGQRLARCFHALYAGMVHWMKPHSPSLLLGTIADLAKGKPELLVENALLRQQLIILRRQVKRPACRKKDRILLMLLARMLRT